MTELYLDCEFNGNFGWFISLALYNPNGESFYEISHDYQSYMKYEQTKVTDFVMNNVLTKLNKAPISPLQVKIKLASYIAQFEDNVIIYADWPEDFVHLCNMLFTVGLNGAPPNKIVPSLTMKLITTPDDHKSAVPHNALEDAKALHLNHKAHQYD